MATQWVLGKVSDALAPTISNTVSSAGSFAGGAVNAVGNTINGVGEGINGSIKRYGDGVKDYGNAVMDWTGAGAVRAGTAANPLGLSANKAGGKVAVTSPSIYAPPKSTPSQKMLTTSKTTGTPMGQKKIAGAPQKKALPAPGPTPVGAKKVTGAGAPVKKAVSAAPAKTPTHPNPGALRKAPAATTAKTNGVTGAAKKVTAVKPSTATATKTTIPKSTTTGRATTASRGNPTAAANPLGLAF
ncbi:hypothetical protein EDD37DRAFT_625263 [Exophiala viscosa]|uniref:Uncharacterized protein n=1 Tax=Exophiala viscosa TaxID=2486360 RepID=A0AAN6DWL6_9EURO|nr:hypothetical protein EDD36DRAFT_240574 [Exophiala viscosa]KAI1625661.1 hypothetical protein EDD37DRAFT_625263 [Exophiala viscosa]